MALGRAGGHVQCRARGGGGIARARSRLASSGAAGPPPGEDDAMGGAEEEDSDVDDSEAASAGGVGGATPAFFLAAAAKRRRLFQLPGSGMVLEGCGGQKKSKHGMFEVYRVLVSVHRCFCLVFCVFIDVFSLFVACLFSFGFDWFCLFFWRPQRFVSPDVFFFALATIFA